MAFTERHFLNSEKIIYQQYHPGDYKTPWIVRVITPQVYRGHFVFFNDNYWNKLLIAKKDDTITIMYENED